MSFATVLARHRVPRSWRFRIAFRYWFTYSLSKRFCGDEVSLVFSCAESIDDSVDLSTSCEDLGESSDGVSVDASDEESCDILCEWVDGMESIVEIVR